MNKENLPRVKLLRKAVNGAVFIGENRMSVLPQSILDLEEGYSSGCSRHLFNSLHRNMPFQHRYLEVGTWMGTTLAASLYGNPNTVALGVEPWYKYTFKTAGVEYANNSYERCKARIDSVIPADGMHGQYTLVDSFAMDLSCAKIVEKAGGKIDVFLDRGKDDYPHVLSHVWDALGDVFVLLCETWNHDPVRLLTWQTIVNKGGYVHHMVELRTTLNGDIEDNAIPQTFKTGLFVAVIEKIK